MSTFNTPSARPPRAAPRVGDYRRGSRARTTRAGTWFPAAGPADEPAGLLLLHPAVKPAVLTAAIERLGDPPPPGVLPMLPQLVDQSGRKWMVVTAAPAPTLADLLDAGPHRTPANAAALLCDVADTLSAAHQVGVAHGAVGAHAVVLGTDGTALLTDWGTDEHASPEGDVAGWSELAELLGERWCADSVTDAAVIARAVRAAEQPGPRGGLDGAVDQLSRLAGRTRRDALSDLATGSVSRGRHFRAEAPASAPAPAAPTAAAPTTAAPTMATPTTATPTTATPTTATPTAATPTAATPTAATPTAELGRRRPTPTRPADPAATERSPDVVRAEPPLFAPTPPVAEPPAAKAPVTRRPPAADGLPLPPLADEQPATKPGRRRARKAARHPVLLTVLLTVVLVAVLAAIIRPFETAKKPVRAPAGPLDVLSVTVTAQMKSSICLLVGNVTTNAQPGRVVYRWVGDNGPLAVSSVSTAASSSQVEIGLLWPPGSPPLRGSSITLQILEPKPSTTTAVMPTNCT